LTGLSALWSGDVKQQQAWLRSVISIPGFLGDAFRAYATNVISVINVVVDGFNTLAIAYKNLVAVFGVRISVPQLPKLSLGQVAGVGKSFKAAEGAFVNARPGGYSGVIGEGKHDEAVLPLSDQVFSRLAAGINSQGGTSSGGMTVEVHLTGTYAGTKADLAKTIRQVLVDGRRTGAIPQGAI